MEAIALFQTFDSLSGRVTGYEHVATVSIPEGVDSCEFVWRRLQNLDGSWSMGELIDWDGMMVDNPDFHEAVTVVKPLAVIRGQKWGHRSMMVGDRVSVGDEMFEVRSFGFEEVK